LAETGVLDAEAIPAGLLRLGGEASDDRGIGERIEQREEETGPHGSTAP
jgi:hypothetical protein